MPNPMKLAEALEVVRKHGRRGDTELAHVNPREAAILKAMGGSGAINPKTGLREYEVSGGGDTPGYDSPGFSGEGGSPAGDTGGMMGDLTGFNAGISTIGRGELERAGIPVAESGPFASTVNQASLAIANPANAGLIGPGIAGLLGMGSLASLGQFAADRARGAGISVDYSYPGDPQGSAQDRGMGIASAMGAPVQSISQPQVSGVPSEISQFIGPGMTPLQQRSAIGTFGTQGSNPAFRTDPVRRYYASLLAQELVNPTGGINESAYLLPVEQQYLGSAFGRQAQTPSQAYEAIRGVL